MKKVWLVVSTIVLLSAANIARATGEEEPPRPPKPPLQGCTPGYWKNHLDAWTTYSPYQSLGDRFEIPAALYFTFVHMSMLDALQAKGGNDVDGAARILMRHAMAALLNMRHPDVNYLLDKETLLALVNGALASLDRAHMLALAAFLTEQNELGCPLN